MVIGIGIKLEFLLYISAVNTLSLLDLAPSERSP